MITKVACGRAGQMVYEFDNGNIVSILWAYGSYSDNNIRFDKPVDTLGDTMQRFNKQEWESTTVEIYSMGKIGTGFTEYLERYHGGNPAGYVPVSEIPKILARADKGGRNAKT